jgi:hypothetical protein
MYFRSHNCWCVAHVIYCIMVHLWLNESSVCVWFLDMLAKLLKTTVSFVMSAHLSIHVEQLSSYGTDFYEI